MQDAACELPRTPLLRASVNKGKEMTGAMQDPVYELPRIHLLRTRVNRAKIHPRFIVLCYKPYLSGPAPSRKRLSRQIALLLAEKRARPLHFYIPYMTRGPPGPIRPTSEKTPSKHLDE